MGNKNGLLIWSREKCIISTSRELFHSGFLLLGLTDTIRVKVPVTYELVYCQFLCRIRLQK
jgi:hypothetical protein